MIELAGRKDLLDANWLLGSSPALNTRALTLVSVSIVFLSLLCLVSFFLFISLSLKSCKLVLQTFYLYIIWISTKPCIIPAEGMNACMHKYVYKYACACIFDSFIIGKFCSSNNKDYVSQFSPSVLPSVAPSYHLSLITYHLICHLHHKYLNDWRSVGQSIFVSCSHLQTMTRFFFSVRELRVSWCGAPCLKIGLICNLLTQLCLGLARAVNLGSKSRRTHDHILLSHLWLPPAWRARYPFFYPPRTGWSSYTPGHRVPPLLPVTTRRATAKNWWLLNHS
jgi:hypothetical protein